MALRPGGEVPAHSDCEGSGYYVGCDLLGGGTLIADAMRSRAFQTLPR
jgi:hypothetical protein